MESKGNQRRQGGLFGISLAVLVALLILTVPFIAKQFMGLNASVEYERSVFISQISEQMKNNVTASRENHMGDIRDYAAVLSEVHPETFGQVRRLFPGYAGNEAVNRLFFLSSDCGLYGIDGHEISAILYGWDSSEYRAALSSRLFEEKSSSLVVGKNGNIVIYPEDEDSESYGYNIFSYLANQGMKEKDLGIFRELLSGTEDKTVLCEMEGSRWLLGTAYYSEEYRIFIMLPIQITSAGTYQNLYGLIAGVVMSFLILFLIVGVILRSVVMRQKVQRDKELQTELLMKTAQAKNEFLAKMSHDIRTPLNGIIGMNYIASTQVASECTEVVDCLKKWISPPSICWGS